MKSPIPLHDLIRRVLAAYQWAVPVQQHSSVQHWSAVVDPEVRPHTKAVRYSDGRLFVEVDTGTLRHELSYRRTTYCERINQRVGAPVVREIVFTVKS